MSEFNFVNIYVISRVYQNLLDTPLKSESDFLRGIDPHTPYTHTSTIVNTNFKLMHIYIGII